MEELRERLAPLTEWIPEEHRDLVPVEVWWLIELTALLAVLVAVGYTLRALLRRLARALFPPRRPNWDQGLIEDLAAYPAVNGPPLLCVQHTPAWLRLVVVAPLGKSLAIDPRTVPNLLERAIPGLTAILVRDQPRALVWPGQLSEAGFINSFHRCTPTGRREGELTGWVVLAGRVLVGRESLLLGMVLWTRDPTTLARMNLEPRQWLDVLRPGAVGEGA